VTELRTGGFRATQLRQAAFQRYQRRWPGAQSRHWPSRTPLPSQARKVTPEEMRAVCEYMQSQGLTVEEVQKVRAQLAWHTLRAAPAVPCCCEFR
jgi:hypothetical protein